MHPPDSFFKLSIKVNFIKNRRITQSGIITQSAAQRGEKVKAAWISFSEEEEETLSTFTTYSCD